MAATTHRLNATADEEYWAQRAKAAAAYNRATYVANPVAVLNQFNENVLNSSSTARRSLRMGRPASRGRGSTCTATKPIDGCWRCRAN
jgi:pectate lyase